MASEGRRLHGSCHALVEELGDADQDALDVRATLEDGSVVRSSPIYLSG